MPFIRQLERITGTLTQPGHDSEKPLVNNKVERKETGERDRYDILGSSSQVNNYGLAGTFGLHVDYRGQSYSHPVYGERIATAMLYLTDVTLGIVTGHWNNSDTIILNPPIRRLTFNRRLHGVPENRGLRETARRIGAHLLERGGVWRAGPLIRPLGLPRRSRQQVG